MRYRIATAKKETKPMMMPVYGKGEWEGATFHIP